MLSPTAPPAPSPLLLPQEQDACVSAARVSFGQKSLLLGLGENDCNY